MEPLTFGSLRMMLQAFRLSYLELNRDVPGHQ